MERAILRRAERLLGEDGVSDIATKRVIIFGVGGVGSWCAESLVRTGIRHLTIVDSDRVCVTNCNRQLMATTKTIGRVKVEAMRERLLDINPDAEITALQKIYEEETAEEFHLETYDYVIDAIDSLKEKAHLILHATSLSRRIKRGELQGEGVAKRLTLFSSMGAALRVDPTKIRVTEFWKVQNDALGKALRKRFKYRKEMPSTKFLCVYSEEPPMENKGESRPCGTPQCICSKKNVVCSNTGADSSNQRLAEHDWNSLKAQINGSLAHITAIFGFTLAGLVIKDIRTLSPDPLSILPVGKR